MQKLLESNFDKKQAVSIFLNRQHNRSQNIIHIADIQSRHQSTVQVFVNVLVCQRFDVFDVVGQLDIE